MEVLGDLVVRDRRSEETAISVPAAGRSFDYRRFITSAWKIGNFLRHLGVRRGTGVAIADDPAPAAVFTLYGAACLGAVVRFDLQSASRAPTDQPRAIVAPTEDLTGIEIDPAVKAVAYGDPPEAPSVASFERDIWSENPTAPPEAVRPADPLVRTEDVTYTHEEVLGAATAVVDRCEIGPETTVVTAPETSFSHAGTVVAALVAPVLVGGTVALGPDADGDLVVGGPDGDVDPATVLGGT